VIEKSMSSLRESGADLPCFCRPSRKNREEPVQRKCLVVDQSGRIGGTDQIRSIARHARLLTLVIVAQIARYRLSWFLE
jgi:hypothetical protein